VTTEQPGPGVPEAGKTARRKKRRNPMVFAAVGIVAFFGVLVTLVVMQLSKPALPPKPEVQQVVVFRPPPPPPPEEEPPPPPPPEVEEEIETPEEDAPPEEEVADAEPPPGDLGLDADGVAGSDAFGLVGRKGGRGITAGGGGSDRYYFGRVEKAIQERLAEVTDLRAAVYEVPAAISFGRDGCIEDVALRRSTGDSGRDDLLMASVTGVCVQDSQTAEKLASRTVNLKIASR
jgi:protein TonB